MSEEIIYSVETIRHMMGLNQKDMAKMLGMTETTYISRVKKKTDWRSRELIKIRQASGIPIDKMDL